LTLCIKSVVNDKLAFKNLLVREPKCSKAAGDPTQTFAAACGSAGCESAAQNFSEEQACRIGKIASLQDRTKRDILAVISEFVVRDKECSPEINSFRVGIMREKHKLGRGIDKISD